MTEPGTPDVREPLRAAGHRLRRICALPAIPTWCRRAMRRAWTRPPFGGEIVDGVLYGRGAADMKGGVACFLAAALDYLQGQRRPEARLALLPDHRRRGIGCHQRHAQAAGLAQGARRDAGCAASSASRRAAEAVGDEIKIGRRGYCQRRRRRARQAGPLRLRRARREPHPEARAHHRPAVDHAARQRHRALPALQPAGDDRLGAERGDQRDTGPRRRPTSTSATTTCTPAPRSRRG